MKAAVFALLLALLFGMIACNDKNDETKVYDADIMIFSDTHVLGSGQFGDTRTPGLNRLLVSNEKTIGLTEAVLKTAIDDFISSDSPILVLTGDLTDDGAKVAHEAVARELKRAEDAGKRCYVINGNHDINNRSSSHVEERDQDIANVSPELFAEIYADFGYSEALVRDVNSLSYTAELTNKYRLIAWDIAKYDIVEGTERDVEGRHDPHVTTEGLAWLSKQLDKCYDDGKTPFIITHFPILSHVGPIVGSWSHVNRQQDVLNVLYNSTVPVPFSFCGHVHQQDIATYTYPNGSKYYEIETGSLSFSSLPKRHFIDDNGDISITYEQQSYVKEEYIPKFYSAEEKAAILADLPAYAKRYVDTSFSKYMYGKLYFDDVCAVFGKYDDESIARVKSIVDAFYDMPLYESDAQEGAKSLESICKKHGVSDLPALDDVKTVGEFLASIVRKNFSGDENMDKDSAEAKTFKYLFYAAFDQVSESKIMQFFGYLPEKTDGTYERNINGLYETGKLEVVESGILGITSYIPMLKKLGPISNYFAGTSAEIAEKLNIVLSEIDTLMDFIPNQTIRDLISDIYDEETGFSSIIDFTETSETGKGYLNIDGLIDVVFDTIGEGLLYDDGAPDNNFSFQLPKATEDAGE